jgi:cytochrome P450
MPAPPRVPGLPLIGNTLRLLRDPIHFPEACAREYGDVVDLHTTVLPTYGVNHPDLIEQVLVRDHRLYIKDKPTHSLRSLLGTGLLTSEGEFWRRQRRLAQPGFHRERVASYGEVMVEYAERMVKTWQSGEKRNAHDDMMRLTREIVAKTLFDADVPEPIAAITLRPRDGLPVVVERHEERSQDSALETFA